MSNLPAARTTAAQRSESCLAARYRDHRAPGDIGDWLIWEWSDGHVLGALPSLAILVFRNRDNCHPQLST